MIGAFTFFINKVVVLCYAGQPGLVELVQGISPFIAALLAELFLYIWVATGEEPQAIKLRCKLKKKLKHIEETLKQDGLPSASRAALEKDHSEITEALVKSI